MSAPFIAMPAVSMRSAHMQALQHLERQVLSGNVEKLILISVDAQGQLSISSAHDPVETLGLLAIAQYASIPKPSAAPALPLLEH